MALPKQSEHDGLCSRPMETYSKHVDTSEPAPAVPPVPGEPPVAPVPDAPPEPPVPDEPPVASVSPSESSTLPPQANAMAVTANAIQDLRFMR
jgi:hypothetical protein